MKRDLLCRIGAILTAVAFAALWLINPTWSQDETVQFLCRSLSSRILGSLVFVFVLLYLRYRVWRLPHWRSLAVFLPALAVVINNLPILALLQGEAHIDRPELIGLFALDSLFIGVFEELAFRGVLFPVLLEKKRDSRRQIFWVTVVSSALFGLIHLANLAEGAGVGSTLLQVGYSFLIGGMCSIVLIKSGNLLLCILLHGIYDFCGGLLPMLGSGSWWDTPTVIFTAVLGVVVAAWLLRCLLYTDPQEVAAIYEKNSKETYEQ